MLLPLLVPLSLGQLIAVEAQVSDVFQASVNDGKTDISCDFSMIYTTEACQDLNPCTVDAKNSKFKCSGMTQKKTTINKAEITSDTGVEYTVSFKISKKGTGKFSRTYCNYCIPTLPPPPYTTPTPPPTTPSPPPTPPPTPTPTPSPVTKDCCTYMTSSGMQCIPYGEYIVWAEKCLYIRCLKVGSPASSAASLALELDPAFSGCDCCVGPDKKTLYEDGAVITLPTGVNATCCKGNWVDIVDVSEPPCDWTEWGDRDNPSGTGDWEHSGNDCVENGIVKYEVRLVSGGQVFQNVDDITLNTLVYNQATGWLYCINKEQVGCKTWSNGFPVGWPIVPPCCQDYATRFCCIPPEVPPQCEWTIWTDLDNPSGVGDFEYPGADCGKHGVQKYEVTNVDGGQIFTDVNQIPENTVQFQQETGAIYCVNAQQEGCKTNSAGYPAGWPIELPCCLDYKARYCCEPQDKVDTGIAVEENGETFVQENSYNNNTGLLEINVPHHGNLTHATFILEVGTDTNLLQTNNSCQLSPLPDQFNLTEMAYGLGEIGTAISGTNSMEYFIIKARESRIGVKEREKLLHQVQSHCSGQPITRTRDIRVSKEDFKSGDVVLVNKAEGNPTERTCSIEWEVCSNVGPIACGYGWTNPDPNAPVAGFTFHQVSNGAICVNCTIETVIPGTPGCNVDPFDQYCSCADITNKEKLMDCRLMDDIVVVDINEGGVQFSQTTTYSNEYDRRAVSIDSPAHNNLTEMKVIMNARSDGYWHTSGLNNNRMMKIGNKCHIDQLPAGHFPIDMAVGMQEIAAANTPIIPEDEVTIYSMLMNEGPINSDLHELVMEACQNSSIFQSREEYITKEDSDVLRNGGVVFRNSSHSTRGPCWLLTAITELSTSSCWRWPNPETGVQISVHNIVNSVVTLSCYEDTHLNGIPCPGDFCLCSDIIDVPSFLDCLNYPGQPPLIVVLTGTQVTVSQGTGRGIGLFPDALYPHPMSEMQTRQNVATSADMTVLDKSGNTLFTSNQSYTNLPPSTNSVGAVFRGTTAMNATMFICAGYIEGSEAPSQCYMYNKGAGFSPIFSLESNFKNGGSGSLVFTTEEGDYWWIIGEDWNGVTTSVYFNLTRNYNLPYTNGISPPTLPKALNVPCITAINHTLAFVTGMPMTEPSDTNQAWLYDFKNNHWTQLPNTLKKRMGASCGVLDTDEGPFIVLAGGLSEDTSEVLNINNATWREGPQLPENPFGYFGGNMVKIENELVLVGGYEVASNLLGLKPLTVNNAFAGFSNWTDLGSIPMVYNAVALLVPRKLVRDLLPPPTPCGDEDCGLYCASFQQCQLTGTVCVQAPCCPAWHCVG